MGFVLAGWFFVCLCTCAFVFICLKSSVSYNIYIYFVITNKIHLWFWHTTTKFCNLPFYSFHHAKYLVFSFSNASEFPYEQFMTLICRHFIRIYKLACEGIAGYNRMSHFDSYPLLTFRDHSIHLLHCYNNYVSLSCGFNFIYIFEGN